MVITNIEAYQQGQKASEKARGNTLKVRNPHKSQTEAWYSWNQGWNSK